MTVCYTGIFYPQKDPYTFFRAVAHWRDSASELRSREIREHFRIWLVGVEDRTTPAVVAQLGLDDVTTFFTRRPQSEARAMCLQSDYLLIASGLNDKSREGWLPSKVFEYLGCRKPIIAVSKQGQLADLIRGTDSGSVFHSSDLTPIIDLLDAALSEKLEHGTLQSNLSFQGVERYSETRMVGQFLKLADDLVTETQS
ncbi:MAG: glycosyltransferase [Pseudomonadota bacterium]